ncbi:MAG TPA: TolC family protein [Bacteroidales bacterium]|nr:TolC family protein [Bacteroidales bacterium]
MKIKTVFTIIFVAWQTSVAVGQDTTLQLSLKQSCQWGVEKNVNVLNAGLEKLKSQYQLKEAQSKLYPQVEGYSNFNYYYAIPKMILPGEIFGQTGMIPVEIGTKYDWSSGFKATQILYNQSYFTSLKLSKRLSEMGDLNIQQKKEEIVYQVSQVYYLCQATKKQIDQLNINMQNNERLIAIAKLQNENGVIRKIDYSRVTVNKSNLQTQIDNLEQLLQQQLGLLKYLVGIDMGTKIELSDSLSFTSAVSHERQPNFGERTELKLLENQIDIASLTRKYNRQQYLPTLSGFGQYYYQGQRNEFDFFEGGNDKFFKTGVVGLSVNVPIFDGFEKHNKIRQSDIELQQLKNTQKNTSDFFLKEYSDATRQYQNSLNALTRQEENIRLAEDTYNISIQGYRQQTVSLSDLLMSENSLTEARLSYYNALLQLKNSELEVKKAKGDLLNY